MMAARAGVATLVVAALSGCAGVEASAQSAQPAQSTPSAAASDPTAGSPRPSVTPSDLPTFTSVRRYEGVALPVRLRIPEAGVDTSLIRLGLTAEGWIAAPKEWDVAGWYQGGPRPGQSGQAVIVGHIDSRSGPAVFVDLPRLRIGAAIRVDRQDGTSVSFRVTSRRQVAKDHFPAQEVYAPTLDPSLLLITCGGVFDSATGHYRDNILVTAVPG